MPQRTDPYMLIDEIGNENKNEQIRINIPDGYHDQRGSPPSRENENILGAVAEMDK